MHPLVRDAKKRNGSHDYVAKSDAPFGFWNKGDVLTFIPEVNTLDHAHGPGYFIQKGRRGLGWHTQEQARRYIKGKLEN